MRKGGEIRWWHESGRNSGWGRWIALEMEKTRLTNDQCLVPCKIDDPETASNYTKLLNHSNFFDKCTFWATWKFLWSIWALQRIAHLGGVLDWILPSCSKHHHVFLCTQHYKWLWKVTNSLWLLPPIRNACFTHHPSHSKIYYTSLSWHQCIFGLIILLCMPLLKCTLMNVVKICHPS